MYFDVDDMEDKCAADSSVMSDFTHNSALCIMWHCKITDHN